MLCLCCTVFPENPDICSQSFPSIYTIQLTWAAPDFTNVPECTPAPRCEMFFDDVHESRSFIFFSWVREVKFLWSHGEPYSSANLYLLKWEEADISVPSPRQNYVTSTDSIKQGRWENLPEEPVEHFQVSPRNNKKLNIQRRALQSIAISSKSPLETTQEDSFNAETKKRIIDLHEGGHVSPVLTINTCAPFMGILLGTGDKPSSPFYRIEYNGEKGQPVPGFY